MRIATARAARNETMSGAGFQPALGRSETCPTLGFIAKPRLTRLFKMNPRVDSEYVRDELLRQYFSRSTIGGGYSLVKHDRVIAEFQRDVQVVSDGDHENRLCQVREDS